VAKPSTNSRHSFHSKSSRSTRYDHLGLLQSKKSKNGSHIHSQRHTKDISSRRNSEKHRTHTDNTNKDRGTAKKQSSRNEQQSSNNDLNQIMTPQERGVFKKRETAVPESKAKAEKRAEVSRREDSM